MVVASQKLHSSAVQARGLAWGAWYARVAKPALDRALAGLCVAVLLPALAFVAVAVLMTLGHPVLYRQHRVGLHGRVIVVHKFRTMRRDRRCGTVIWDGEERRVYHKSAVDPRHTACGRFLRKWSLDELPQLFNVLTGDMSLVGPRPEVLPVVRGYEPWQHRRHDVKPGITGLWQVSARGDGPMHQHTDIDLEYVDRMSWRLDLRILLATLPAALGRRVGG